MNIEVTKDNVVILEESNTPHENEYKITTCYFTFDTFTSDFEVKYAVFTILSSQESYKVDIINNQCDIPVEVLKHEYETVKLGVYGENIDDSGEDEVLEKRFSPSYATFIVPTGSYVEDANEPEIITPSQYDLYSQALQEGLDEVESALQEVENVDIDASKVDHVATVTITNRNGVEKSVNVYDGENGASFEYDWDGTSLGVKTSEEQEYEYVDLKGDKGDQGIPGKDGYTPQKGIDYFTPQDIASLNIPRKTSDLNNDSGFITNNTNDLVNYYKKTETYNKTEIDSKISSVYRYKGSVATYQDLPSGDLTVGDVYNVESDGSNYAWNGTAWDKLGGDIDLSDYYTSSQVDSLLSNKLEQSDLVDYVKNTDFATNSKGGVVKGNVNGFSIGSTGNPYASNYSYSQYDNIQDTHFISKGTLENVITGKNLETANNKVTTLSSSSTDTQYPSAKCVYDIVGDIATTLDTIQREVI
jgi:hypothetical protein